MIALSLKIDSCLFEGMLALIWWHELLLSTGSFMFDCAIKRQRKVKIEDQGPFFKCWKSRMKTNRFSGHQWQSMLHHLCKQSDATTMCFNILHHGKVFSFCLKLWLFSWLTFPCVIFWNIRCRWVGFRAAMKQTAAESDGCYRWLFFAWSVHLCCSERRFDSEPVGPTRE